MIAGADHDDIRALVFPDLEVCRSLHPICGRAGAADIVSHQQCAREFRSCSTVSPSRAPAAPTASPLVLLADLPSLDAGEITDKGSINQRAVLRCRAAEVARTLQRADAIHVLAIDKRG